MTPGAAAAIGAGIAILSAFGGALGVGLASKGGAEATARQPEQAGAIRTISMLGMILAETCAIYGVLIAILLVSKIS